MTDLVEAPQALLGHFEERYLDLPMPVLIGVMKKHQRYFPSCATANCCPTSSPSPTAATWPTRTSSSRGNEGVIRARYADAAYFYRQDTARTAGGASPRAWCTLTFHAKLGSMLDKVERLRRLRHRSACRWAPRLTNRPRSNAPPPSANPTSSPPWSWR